MEDLFVFYEDENHGLPDLLEPVYHETDHYESEFDEYYEDNDIRNWEN